MFGVDLKTPAKTCCWPLKSRSKHYVAEKNNVINKDSQMGQVTPKIILRRI